MRALPLPHAHVVIRESSIDKDECGAECDDGFDAYLCEKRPRPALQFVCISRATIVALCGGCFRKGICWAAQRRAHVVAWAIKAGRTVVTKRIIVTNTRHGTRRTPDARIVQAGKEAAGAATTAATIAVDIG